MSHNVHYAGNDRHHAEVDVEIDLGPDPHSSSAVRGPDSSHSSQQDRAFRRGERCGHCFRRRWIRLIFRAINLGFALLFGASAALQYNDKVAVLWVAIYFAAAVFCILSELSWRVLRTYIVLPSLWVFTVSTTIGAVYILIAKLLIERPPGGASSPAAYDFWGLLLVSFWMSVVLYLDRHNVVGVFRGYTSLDLEHERDKDGHVQMGEVVL